MNTIDLLSVGSVGIATVIWLIYTWKKSMKNKTGMCGTCSSGKCSSKSFATTTKPQKITFHR